jgi:hypothetical protein
MIHPLEHLGVYGGGADEQVENRGGTSGSSVCPHGLVYRMDELRILLMPPRSSVLLLGGDTSSSMIRGDSETECLLEELDDGAFDDRVFLGKILVALFLILTTLTHNECTGGFLPARKTHKRSIWSDGNYGEFSYYYCRRVMSEVHKLGCILAHRVCGLLNMQPPIKVKLN